VFFEKLKTGIEGLENSNENNVGAMMHAGACMRRKDIPFDFRARIKKGRRRLLSTGSINEII